MQSKIYNFYPQTGFCFNWGFHPKNNFFSGSIYFLNSGVNNSINFISGKILNHIGEFVSSYNNNLPIAFSGNMSNNNFNYFIQNNLIYVEENDYGYCSGIEFYTNQDGSDTISFFNIYGDKPSYAVDNDRRVLSNSPINCFISGNSNNIKDFLIYELHIGGTLDANLGNSNYVPRNYFEISGQNIWESGISISPGQVFNFTINQIDFIYSSENNFIYIPLYMETNFGTQYFVFFVKIINEFSIEKMLINSYTSIVDEGAIFNIDILFDPLKEPIKDFFVYISGVSGNDFSNSFLTDTFTGSWGIDFGGIDFYPQIIKKETLLFDNTNNLSFDISKSGKYYDFILTENGAISGLSGFYENQMQIDSGIYNGLVFTVPNIYNTRFEITGIDFAIYSTGFFTGNKTNEINSGISGGFVNIDLYELDNNYKFINKMNSYSLKLSGLKDYTDNNSNIYSLTGIYYNVYANHKYALILSGYSSGKIYGYELFLPTGNVNYTNSGLELIGSISGYSKDMQEYGGVVNFEKLPFFRIFGNMVTDANILSGKGDLNFKDGNDNATFNDLLIYKLYNYNNVNNYTGSAFLYISGGSGFERSGYLNVYKNMFREINSSIEIF